MNANDNMNGIINDNYDRLKDLNKSQDDTLKIILEQMRQIEDLVALGRGAKGSCVEQLSLKI